MIVIANGFVSDVGGASVGHKIASHSIVSQIKTPGKVANSWTCANCTCQNKSKDCHCVACGEANPKQLHNHWGHDHGPDDSQQEDDLEGTDSGTIWFCVYCSCGNDFANVMCCACGRLRETKTEGSLVEKEPTNTEPQLLLEYCGIKMYQKS